MTRPIFSWRHAILKSELSPTTRHVLLTLSCHMNDAGESCFPSIATLVEETGLSRSSVISHIKLAKEAGWIMVGLHGFGGQKWKSHEYTSAIPESVLCREGGPGDRPPLSEGGPPAGPAMPEGGPAPDKKVVQEVDPNSTSTNSTSSTNSTREAPPIGSDPHMRKKAAAPLDYCSWPTMPSAQVMADWVAARKAKRAPISQTVINQFGNEMHKAAALGYSVDQCLAECITSGWQGFKAEWIANRNKTGGTNGQSGRPDRESVSARAVREAAEFIADLDAAERLERDQADGSGGVYENELALPWEGIGGLPGAR